MTLVDTHTHLYMPEFAEDGGGEAAVRRALGAGVGRMVFPNVDASTIAPMEGLAARFPDVISVAMGLHPTEVGPGWEAVVDDMEGRLLAPGAPYVAVGEVGMDLYWDASHRDEQMQALERQARLAVASGLPLIIHCREALPETLEVLSGVPGTRGVMHSFGGTVADVEAVRRVADMYFGINGIITFKNSRVADALPAIGADRIVLETDSPYLAPVPRRGRRNESAFLPYVNARVAQALGLTAEETAAVTTDNAERLFSLQIPIIPD